LHFIILFETFFWYDTHLIEGDLENLYIFLCSNICIAQSKLIKTRIKLISQISLKPPTSDFIEIQWVVLEMKDIEGETYQPFTETYVDLIFKSNQYLKLTIIQDIPRHYT
jgi:hypothetical protein